MITAGYQKTFFARKKQKKIIFFIFRIEIYGCNYYDAKPCVSINAHNIRNEENK